ETAGVLAPPPLLYGAALVAGLALQRLVPLARLPRRARPLGLALLALGAAFGVPAFRPMRRAGTPVDPRKPSTALVESGPFRISRNPGYVGMTLVYAGIATLRGAVWPFLLLPAVLAVITRGVIEREERYLERRFGDAYRAYRGRVRRWL